MKLSIKIFVTKSIEYALQGNDISSIGFVVPDSCSNETILAEEIINEARRQIEERKLWLKISYICLSEQTNFYKQFSNLLKTMTNVRTYVDWSTTGKILH